MSTAESLDVDALPPAEDFEAPVAPAVRGALSWRPGAGEPVPLGRAGYVSLGSFGSWLHQAKIADPYAIELPGATVMLPAGVGIATAVEGVIRRHYGELGYLEFDFPHLVPVEALEPTRNVIKLENALLRIGDDADWAAGTPRAVLSPTGESSVYTYWSRTVRTRQDLPLRMFRRARYYRPAAPGRSLLRGIESSGVFEFQSCHPDAESARAEFRRTLDMCGRICAEVGVPALRSTRPPWTNNATVAEACVGFDVPLPHGATLQVGCVYDQADRFSRHYDVHWSDGTERHFTGHVAGCLTRRLMLSHLFLGIDSAGELLVHPSLAPVQVGITVHGPDAAAGEAAEVLARALRSAGVRVAVGGTSGSLAPGAQQRLWRRQGVPLRVYVHSGSGAAASARMVAVRGDNRYECDLPPGPAGPVATQLAIALAEVGHGCALRAYRFVTGQVRAAAADEVRDVVRARRVAVSYLEPTEEAVRAVGAWQQGEVIGFRQAATSGACVLSGRPTRALAYISPRT